MPYSWLMSWALGTIWLWMTFSGIGWFYYSYSFSFEVSTWMSVGGCCPCRTILFIWASVMNVFPWPSCISSCWSMLAMVMGIGLFSSSIVCSRCSSSPWMRPIASFSSLFCLFDSMIWFCKKFLSYSKAWARAIQCLIFSFNSYFSDSIFTRSLFKPSTFWLSL